LYKEIITTFRMRWMKHTKQSQQHRDYSRQAARLFTKELQRLNFQWCRGLNYGCCRGLGCFQFIITLNAPMTGQWNAFGIEWLSSWYKCFQMIPANILHEMNKSGCRASYKSSHQRLHKAELRRKLTQTRTHTHTNTHTSYAAHMASSSSKHKSSPLRCSLPANRNNRVDFTLGPGDGRRAIIRDVVSFKQI
jgi:hypothetical protein